MLEDISGCGNQILYDVNSRPLERGDNRIVVKGSRNKIVFGSDVVLNGFVVVVESDDNLVEIGDRCRITGKVIMKIVGGNRLSVGDGTSIGGCNFIVGEGTSVVVGRDCMLAWGLEIRTTDSHGIYDKSGARVNPALDIVIGDRNWIGAQATLLRGACVSDDSVIGIRSVVTDKFDECGVVIAGVPGRIVRRGISWKRELLG